MNTLRTTLLLCFWITTISLASAQSFLNRLDTPDDFTELMGLPLSQKYGEVRSVKLVYHVKKDQIYFINADRYKYHYDFCAERLGFFADNARFNQVNYGPDEKKDFWLANLVYFEASDQYALETSTADLMSAEALLRLRSIIIEHSFLGEELYLFLNTARQQRLFLKGDNDRLLLTPSDIYGDLQYQAIRKGTSRGTLRYVKAKELDKQSFAESDILVLDGTPETLPRVSGIMVPEFQTPLSHLVILAQNRGIPMCAYKGALSDTSLTQLDGLPIRYQVKRDGFELNPDKKKKSDRKTRQRTIQLKYDLDQKEIIDIAQIDHRSSRYVGNKAANFGELYKISQEAGFRVPEKAFAIPFYYYQQHIDQTRAPEYIRELIRAEKTGLSVEGRKTLLKKIRKEIQSHEVDAGLLSAINERVCNGAEYPRMRFRSSTNAEDARGFSGAGLYSSKTGIQDHPKKSFARAIKKVWASLWSYPAYMERSYFNIDQEDVYMGILVHRSFPDEEVNGVAIAKNIYRPGAPGFVINAQLGDHNVVRPDSGVVNEQFICLPSASGNLYKDKRIIEIITRSSLTQDTMTMTEREIQHLADQLEIVKQHYLRKIYRRYEYHKLGLDIEFKIDGADRALYLKQLRLYND